MTFGPFQIYGDTVPQMIGRRKAMDRLLRNFKNDVPNHMVVIGSRKSGKTVIVEALLSELRKVGKPFD